MVLGKDYENIFKCGVSVAPVSSWLYYGTYLHKQLTSRKMQVIHQQSGTYMNT